MEEHCILFRDALKRVTEAKFLGVIVDDRLTWTSHVKALKAKMSRYAGIMYRIKRHLPVEVRLQIYHSFVQCHVNYCCLVWGFSSKSNIESIFNRQKRGCGQLCRVTYNISTKMVTYQVVPRAVSQIIIYSQYIA